MSQQSSVTYSERLWPSLSFFLALVLIIPALTVLFTPFSLRAGVIAGFIAYVAVCGIFLASTRKLQLADGVLTAARARIAVTDLGEVEALNGQELRVAIGRRLDARAHLCISGWVKTGIRVAVTDPEDPTPYWVISTRKPETLAERIRQAQQLATPASHQRPE